METTTKHNNCAALNETNKIITNELIMTIQNQPQKTNPEKHNKTQQTERQNHKIGNKTQQN